MEETTYDVRVYKTEVYRGRKVSTYKVRWKTADKPWKEPFRLAAQADSYRSSLLTAARRGEAFSLRTGRPVSWKHDEPSASWYEFTLAYSAAKWPYASPNHRRGIAEALTDATEAMLDSDRPAYPNSELRRALRSWAFSARLRDGREPPGELAAVVNWLEGATVPLTALTVPGTGAVRTRALLDRISRKQDGSPAAANTANRKRMVIGNAMQYAVEMHLLPINPVTSVKWIKPRTLKTVDPRVVVNPGQARRLLTAIRDLDPWGPRLEAFFGAMYYAALRPEEAVDLRRENLFSLPTEGWGEMLLTNSHPRSGTLWTNTGASRERRALKHRPDGDTRPVPAHPALVRMLRYHLDTFRPGKGGPIFTGPRGGIVTEHVYLEVFHQARRVAFTEEEAASPLAEIPYQLRHACVSTWLNAGVPATQVAEWAGHSVAVLLRVYAKCIAGQQAEAKRRILGVQPEDTPDGPPDHRLANATLGIPDTPDNNGEKSQLAATPTSHAGGSAQINQSARHRLATGVAIKPLRFGRNLWRVGLRVSGTGLLVRLPRSICRPLSLCHVLPNLAANEM